MFGFCDIRRFTDTTEVLQEGVMEFVNVIAHLVHSAVAARGGAANKNIGDAFLLVSLTLSVQTLGTVPVAVTVDPCVLLDVTVTIVFVTHCPAHCEHASAALERMLHLGPTQH